MKTVYQKWGCRLLILLLLQGCQKNNRILLPDMRPYRQSPSLNSTTALPLSLSALQQANADTVGILRIDEVLEEVIVQGKDNHEYLWIDFEGNKTQAGVSFLDFRCHNQSKNLIIYGHSSRRQNIYFTELVHYLESEYLNAHSEITFETEQGISRYEIFSVFLFDVTKPQRDDAFQTDWYKEYLFSQAIKQLNKQSIISLEIPEVTIQQLITLVTCNPTNQNERIVLVAWRKENSLND